MSLLSSGTARSTMQKYLFRTGTFIFALNWLRNNLNVATFHFEEIFPVFISLGKVSMDVWNGLICLPRLEVIDLDFSF